MIMLYHTIIIFLMFLESVDIYVQIVSMHGTTDAIDQVKKVGHVCLPLRIRNYKLIKSHVLTIGCCHFQTIDIRDISFTQIYDALCPLFMRLDAPIRVCHLIEIIPDFVPKTAHPPFFFSRIPEFSSRRAASSS